MKRLLILGIISLLQSCYHDGCFYSPQSVSCIYKGEVFPSISRYQKPYSLGKTNSEQRWKDVVACGGKYGDYANDNITTVEKADSFYSCMVKKGYIHLTPAKCGYQNSKWDKGVCNL